MMCSHYSGGKTKKTFLVLELYINLNYKIFYINRF